MTNSSRRLLGALLIVLVAALAACSAGSASPNPSADPSQPSGPSQSPGAEPSGEASEGAPASPDGEGPIDPGDGIGDGTEPGGGPGQPGTPELVVPRPGQQMVQRVGASALDARVDGRHVVLNARFWSGVEPCSVLDSVDVARNGQTIDITLLVGTSDPDAMCMALAVEKVVVVDLGELEPGTYTIGSENGDAEPISVEVG